MTDPSPQPIGWDDSRTVRYYEAFCERHSRYREANEALAAHAALAPGQRVLDLGAGTGRTAEAVLPHLGEWGRVVCVEPAAAMRAVGIARLSDPRVAWRADLPQPPEAFDRILCGAAIWQMLPLPPILACLCALLRDGGALCFNVPSLYLGEPDEPGGGRDPLLLELMARVAAGRVPRAAAAEPMPSAADVDRALAEAGFRAERWRHRAHLTQAAYRDWLKIPVLTDALLPDLDPGARARRIDEAYREVDADSWRWEGWAGWTAWKR